jgi:hypothetical protein
MNYFNDNSAKNQAAAQTLGLGALQGACAGRQTAKGALRDRVCRLRREADQLEALLKALPEELPGAADAALWEIAIR